MFFKNNKNQNNNLLKIAALLIHAAKIDENFTIEEEKIIEETLLNLGANKENVKQIIIESKKDKDETFVEIACLLIHASKIDENYTNNEKEIIKKTLINLKCSDNEVENIIEKALEIEGNSNQILDFTRKLKDVEEDKKVSIIEALWKIIYSDKKSDMYEDNLMRRLTGLLYLDPKVVGDIKERIKKEQM